MFASIALIAMAIAFVIGMLFTPLASRLAEKIGAVDRPDAYRKKHERPVALLGGVAVAAAVVLSVLLMLRFQPQLLDPSTVQLMRGLIPAAIILFVVGLIDDLIGLTGVYKLVGQVLSVSILVAGGFEFEVLSILGFEIALGSLSVPFTMFFCLGAINAFNLIDGADGLASSVGAIVFATLGTVAAVLGESSASLVCFTSSGALMAFLCFNAPPARIYLGDTGSMLIGLVVAAVAVHCTIKEQAGFALLVPVAICAIPIIDAGAAMIRRITTGQSVFSPDRGHLHHSLLLRGWSVARTVAAIAVLTAITCGGALASFFTGKDYYALVAGAGVFAAMAAARVFGHVEVALIASHTRASWRKFVRRFTHRSAVPAEKSLVLQGNRHWDKIWVGLTEAAPNYDLSAIKLSVNVPYLHESFYATWSQDKANGSTHKDTWQLSLPLACGPRQIGQLTIKGGGAGESPTAEIQGVLEFLEPLESQIAEILNAGDAPIEDQRRVEIRPRPIVIKSEQQEPALA